MQVLFCDRNVVLKIVENWDLMMTGDWEIMMELQMFILFIQQTGILLSSSLR
jgi:hypothetical protein